MDNTTLLGLLLSKISIVSSKVKNILTGISSVSNVNNKLHYEFTNGSNADFEVTGDINLIADIDYVDGHLKIVE